MAVLSDDRFPCGKSIEGCVDRLPVGKQSLRRAGQFLYLMSLTVFRLPDSGITEKMNIAIDCRPLQNKYARRGIGTVVRNLLSQLVRSRYSSSIILCGNNEKPPMRCGRYVMLKRPESHDWLHEQLRWPLDLRSLKAGIFHATVSLGIIREIGFPLVTGVKSIATVYDLNPLRLPSLRSHVTMKSFLVQRMAIRRAHRVLTISEFVKKDLVEKLHRIVVLPCAVDEVLAHEFTRFSPDTALPHEPYILALGEGEHKNIETAIAVFERLAEGGFAGTLRVVGWLDGQTETVKRAVRSSNFRQRIVFAGSLTPEHLVANYALCRLFLFPSRLEGFGLPVMEAMYCGAPVVSSNATALPEAGGDAAVYCDPDDIDGMVHASNRVLDNEEYRNDLIARGKLHANRTTWNQAAETVMALYDELGASPETKR
jgi:glycosyltransferase involved in cell wall biosynthesis